MLEEFLKTKGIWHRFISKPETVHTADASKITGLEINRLTKNLVSMTDKGEHVLLIVQGDKKVDLRKASLILGAKNISLLPFEEAEAVSGYPPGGTPSVGHKTPIKVIIDQSLLKYETIFCGGGSRDRILELRVEDVVRANNAIRGDIIKEY